MEENISEFDKESLIIFVTKMFEEVVPPDLMHNIKIYFNKDDDMIIRFNRVDKRDFQDTVEYVSKSNNWDTVNDLFHTNSGEYLI